MKKLITVLTLLIGFVGHSQFISDENAYVYSFLDPTFTDNGFQLGVGIKKNMNGFWASGELSNYFSQKRDRVGYTDLVGSFGMAINLFDYEPITYYAGARLGPVFRDGILHALAGGVLEFNVKVYRDISIGLRYWADYRTDQDNNAYGDSDAYDGGILIDNPMIQENVAGVILIRIN